MKKLISETSGAIFSLPWFVAKDEGLFAAEGIDMEFVEVLSYRAVGIDVAVGQSISVSEFRSLLDHAAWRLDLERIALGTPCQQMKYN